MIYIKKFNLTLTLTSNGPRGALAPMPNILFAGMHHHMNMYKNCEDNSEKSLWLSCSVFVPSEPTFLTTPSVIFPVFEDILPPYYFISRKQAISENNENYIDWLSFWL